MLRCDLRWSLKQCQPDLWGLGTLDSGAGVGPLLPQLTGVVTRPCWEGSVWSRGAPGSGGWELPPAPPPRPLHSSLQG